MKDLAWKLIARFLSQPAVADWLIERAQRTPYSDIVKTIDGVPLRYMQRWWLFNAYPGQPGGPTKARWYSDLLPAARIHRIWLPDIDQHPHDHPWAARTIPLRNWYREQRAGEDHTRLVKPGMSAKLELGTYHQIVDLPADGVWTLFITWKYQGTWGFLVNNRKVPWRKYLGLDKGNK